MKINKIGISFTELWTRFYAGLLSEKALREIDVFCFGCAREHIFDPGIPMEVTWRTEQCRFGAKDRTSEGVDPVALQKWDLFKGIIGEKDKQGKVVYLVGNYYDLCRRTHKKHPEVEILSKYHFEDDDGVYQDDLNDEALRRIHSIVTVDCAVVLLSHGDRCWMSLRKMGQFEGMWQNPGGKIDPGELPVEAAVREIKEETGLNLSPDRFRGIGTTDRVDPKGEPYTNHWFVVALTDDEVPAQLEPEKHGPWKKVAKSEWLELPLMPGSKEQMVEINSQLNERLTVELINQFVRKD